MRRHQSKDAKKRRKRQGFEPLHKLPRPLGTLRRGIPARSPRGRRYTLYPGGWDTEHGGHPNDRIEVFVSRTRARMLRDGFLVTGSSHDWSTQGFFVNRVSTIGPKSRVHGDRRFVRFGGATIGVVFLNERDWMQKPSELGSHEMVHAGMAYMRLKQIDPVAGNVQEEALAYTIGWLVKQLNNVWYAHRFRL
jgi:hypothetical protein